MKNIWTILKREFRAYFNMPIAYIFITFFLVILNTMFMVRFFLINEASMRSYFGMLPLFFLFFVPAVTMRLWSEERKVGTYEILFTLPMKTSQVVLGKFLAGYAFLTITILLTCTIPITIAVLSKPDWGPIIGAYMGAILLGGVYLSVGAFASSITENQIVAFIIGVSLSFILLIIGFPNINMFISSISPALAGFFSYVGVTTHFDNLSKGILDSRDIIYYISMMFFFLLLNNYQLESKKY
jgi:gliding motility-associated transport system permease protein